MFNLEDDILIKMCLEESPIDITLDINCVWIIMLSICDCNFLYSSLDAWTRNNHGFCTHYKCCCSWTRVILLHLLSAAICCHGMCTVHACSHCLFSKVPKSTWSTLKVDTPVLSFGHKCSLLALATSIYKHRRSTLDILFSSNRNIHKSSCGLCIWASDPLIERF